MCSFLDQQAPVPYFSNLPIHGNYQASIQSESRFSPSSTLLTLYFPPSYLSTEEDVKKLVRGVRLCLQIARTEPLAPLLDHEFTRADLDHELHLKSDAELEALIRERVETVYHPTTTCRMGPNPENGDVVDSRLRVYGVEGLRVCDAAIFPFIVSGHTVCSFRRIRFYGWC